MSWSAKEGDEATSTVSTVSIGREWICAVMYGDSMCCMKPPNGDASAEPMVRMSKSNADEHCPAV
jgi:hypothetical protein